MGPPSDPYALHPLRVWDPFRLPLSVARLVLATWSVGALAAVEISSGQLNRVFFPAVQSTKQVGHWHFINIADRHTNSYFSRSDDSNKLKQSFGVAK